ncbi:MAG: glycosyltransferase family 39 protein [Myxococcota bacterium]|nr:glycosyltransferase family 39 protein [Myxococcota bacterium]
MTRRMPGLFLLLSILGGIVIALPMRDLHPLLATGDSGRDLYGYWLTQRGGIPYRDYYWNFGPLMPYYFALFLELFGGGIKSVLIGATVLRLASGICIYLILRRLTSPVLAFLGALWFWTSSPEFYYTWNHAGAVLANLLACYLVIAHLQRPDRRWVLYLFPVVFAAILVKANAGAATLAACLVSLAIIDRSRGVSLYPPNPRYLLLATAAPAAALLVYVSLVFGLPRDYLLQCFPFSPGYDPPASGNLIDTVQRTFDYLSSRFTDPRAFMPGASTLLTPGPNRTFGAILAGSLLLLAVSFIRQSKAGEARRNRVLVLSLLLVFSSFSLHEFFLSGVLHRLSWGTPLLIVLAFYLIHLALHPLPIAVKATVWLALFAAIAVDTAGVYRFASQLKARPDQHLSLPAADLFVSNRTSWVKTVEQVTRHLEAELAPDETFFALPYDPLYYFLTERAAPAREYIFFDFLNISERQERDIIARLEERGVDTILVSNREKSDEPGLGDFGQSYGVILHEYLKRHFREVAEFGRWSAPPGWAWNHAVRIYRRNPGDP